MVILNKEFEVILDGLVWLSEVTNYSPTSVNYSHQKVLPSSNLFCVMDLSYASQEAA